MRVVLFPHTLLLSVSEMQDEMILEGWVVNGGWTYKNNGRTEQAWSYDTIENEWPTIQDNRIVYVPDDIKGNYNEVIDWARQQLATTNLNILFKSHEARSKLQETEDDDIPF